MKILYLQPGPGIGGSKISLYHVLKQAAVGQVSQVALTLPADPEYEEMLIGTVEKFHYLNLPTWNKYKRRTMFEKIKAPASHARRLVELLPAAYRLAKIIREEQVDLVHTNNGMCAAGAMAACLTKRPHVWHVRELLGTKGEYPLILGDQFSANLFHRWSDVIICNSEYTAGFFRARGYQVTVISNGLDLAAFDGAEERGARLRRKLFNHPEHAVVGMVGNLTTRWKKHDIFLDTAGKIAEIFPECQFVVFGSSTNLNATVYTRELKTKVNDLHLGDRLVWAEFTSDVPAMMHSMDVLIHPAAREGSGRVVMETMAAGKPVVGVRSGGVQELIEDGVTGYLVEPDSIAEFVERTTGLLRDADLRIGLGSRAKGHAHAHFSNERMMQQITDLYSDVLGKKNRAISNA